MNWVRLLTKFRLWNIDFAKSNTIFTNLPPTCMPTYVRAYLPTYVPTYLPICIPSILRIFIPAYVPTFFPTILPTYIPTLIHTYLPTKLSSYLPSKLLSCVPINPLTFILTCFYTNPPIYKRIYLCMRLSILSMHRDRYDKAKEVRADRHLPRLNIPSLAILNRDAVSGSGASGW